MNKKLIISLAMVCVMAFGAGLGTYAWFTSTAASTDNVFQSGTLKLDINGDGEGSYDLGLGTINNIAPGDVFDPISIEITNDGSLDLAWFGRFVFDENAKLAEAIYIKEAKMEFLTPTGTWLEADHFIANGRGSGNWPADYNAMADSNPMGVVTLKSFVSRNSMGAGLGVMEGALTVGNRQKITFELGMAPLANDAYQGDKVLPMTLKYVVDATQVNVDAMNNLNTARPYYSNLGGQFTHLNNLINLQ